MSDPSMVVADGQVPQRYVVVGASGILAPLGRLLSRPGVVTIGISRGGRLAQGDWDERVALDAVDANAIRRFVQGGGGIETVTGYEPAMSPESWALLVRGSRRQVIVLPSRYGAPGSNPEALRAWLDGGSVTSVQLGWTGPVHAPRWHNPEEVSAITARAVEHGPGGRLVLGRVRPWRERPQ